MGSTLQVYTMSFLFKRRKETEAEESGPAAEPECPHSALVPRWDELADMGKPEKVSRYICESCHQDFSREEGERVLAEQRERLHVDEMEQLRQDAAEAET